MTAMALALQPDNADPQQAGIDKIKAVHEAFHAALQALDPPRWRMFRSMILTSLWSIPGTVNFDRLGCSEQRLGSCRRSKDYPFA